MSDVVWVFICVYICRIFKDYFQIIYWVHGKVILADKSIFYSLHVSSEPSSYDGILLYHRKWIVGGPFPCHNLSEITDTDMGPRWKMIG